MQSSGNEASLSSVQMRSTMEAHLGDAVRIVEVLGSNGAEYLLRGRDRERGDDIFIRVFAADPAAAPDAYRSFAQSAETAALLDHPSLAPVRPLQRLDGLAYFIIPGAGANTLESLLAGEKLLPFDRSIAFLRDIASALDYAHEQGVVHGHLEPSSIGLRRDGRVMVTGFGVGSGFSFSHSGRSPAYVAPEQWQPHATITGRADIYALGVIAFEMISGRHRAISLSADGIAMVDPLPVTQDVPLHPGIGLHVNQALLRAVSKHAVARFATAGELVAMLEGRSHTPLYGLPTQRPTLDVERSSHFALVPMFLVIIGGVALGVFAAPSARQALRETGHFSAITDGFDFRPSISAASGYSSSPSSSPAGTTSGNATNSSNSSSSGSIFPGAATAAGGGTSGPSSAAPRTSSSSSSPAQSSNSAAGSTSGAATGASPSGDQASAGTPEDSSGFVRVELDGASALVIIDRMPRGRTPFFGKLHTGAHSVSVVSTSAVQPDSRQIVVRQSDTTTASFSVAPAAPR
jgi:serine/threonine protein kinase